MTKLYSALNTATYPLRHMARGMLVSADLFGTVQTINGGDDSTVGGDAALDQYNERDGGLVGHVIKASTALGIVGVVVASEAWPVMLGYIGVNVISSWVNAGRRWESYKLIEDKKGKAEYINDLLDGKNPPKVKLNWGRVW